jgi:hypothetical protein
MGNESDAGNGTDQEVKPNNAVKACRKLREQDMRLEPLCDEVIKSLLS